MTHRIVFMHPDNLSRKSSPTRFIREHGTVAVAMLMSMLTSACAPAIRGNATNREQFASAGRSAASHTANESRALASNAERCGNGGADPELYFALPYGTESTFNPVSQILNEGFDYWQLAGQDRRIEQVDYDGALRMIGRSIKHADRSINSYGKRKWFREEILPVGKSGAWIPNYQLHFLGSGMQSVRMQQWYEQYRVPKPRLMSAVTMMTSHVLNEIVELRTDYGYSGASMVDLLVLTSAALSRFSIRRCNASHVACT